MKYAVGMGSSAMIYMLSYIMSSSGVQKFLGWAIHIADAETAR
jgi:hypothetical protein